MLRSLALLASALALARVPVDARFCIDEPHPITMHNSSGTGTNTSSLPVVFFHGAGLNASSAYNFEKNLTDEGRTFVALSFCEDDCTADSILHQVKLAITQLHGIVDNDARFNDGYIFIAHSLGGAISRGVIEDMDDHKVRKYISLAGVQNGVFFGPQPRDAGPTELFVTALGPSFIPQSLMNFSAYSAEDLRGKMQSDLGTKVAGRADLQDTLSAVNLPRSPVFEQWVNTSTFFPMYNNLNVCMIGDKECQADQLRRKANFLKLRSAHFFASPSDGFIAPWQSSILGEYSEVATVAEIKTNFEEFVVLPVTKTREYKSDSYGLRTLDKRGGLALHAVDNVPHECWIGDIEGDTAANSCDFDQVYDQHIYPLLK